MAMQFAGGLSRAEAIRQRKALLADIDREHRRKDRETLAELRVQILEARRQRAQSLKDAVQLCRHERRDVKERSKERRRTDLEELRELAKTERDDARRACNGRKADIRESGGTQIKKAQQIAREERAYQAEIRGLARRAKERQRGTRTAHERRSESDDEVRSNLPPEFLSLFESVKRHIRGGQRESRTEAFLRYVEEHPGELAEVVQGAVDREIARLVKEEKRLAKAVRASRPARLTAEQLASVPF